MRIEVAATEYIDHGWRCAPLSGQPRLHPSIDGRSLKLWRGLFLSGSDFSPFATKGRSSASLRRPGAAAQAWLEARQAELLPVPYYHVAFTVPAEVADIAYQNKAVVYDILFKAASQALLTIAADPNRHAAHTRSVP